MNRNKRVPDLVVDNYDIDDDSSSNCDNGEDDADIADALEPDVKRQRFAPPILGVVEQPSNLLNSYPPPAQGEVNYVIGSSSDSDENIAVQGETSEWKEKESGTFWPTFPSRISGFSTSESDSDINFPTVSNQPEPMASQTSVTEDNLNILQSRSIITNRAKNSIRNLILNQIPRSPHQQLQSIPITNEEYKSDSDGSTSSADSFPFVQKNIGSGLDVGIDRIREDIRRVNSHITSRFPFSLPLPKGINSVLQKALDEMSDSSMSSFPSDTKDLVLPPGWEDSEDSQWSGVCSKPVNCGSNQDDRVYDLEFEPASVSESEFNQNPIEDGSSSSGLDEKFDVYLPPSASEPENRQCKEKDAAIFADEESDYTDKSDPHGISSDSELSEKDKWPCHQCKALTYAVSRYCLRCFRTRRNWLPKRPKFKSRSRTKSASVKESNQNEKLKEPGSKHSCSSDSSSSSNDSVSDDDQNHKSIDNSNSGISPANFQTKNTDNQNQDHVKSPNHRDQNPTRTCITLPKEQLNEFSQTSSTSSSNSANPVSLSMKSNMSLAKQSTGNHPLVINSSQENIPTASTSSESQSSSLFSQSSENSLSQSSSKSQQSVVLFPEPGVKNSSKKPKQKSLSQNLLDAAYNPLKVEQVVPKVPMPRRNSATVVLPFQEICSMCCIREKDAAFVHNKIAHHCCCFPCADRILKKTGKCPICREKILRVVKIISG